MKITCRAFSYTAVLCLLFCLESLAQGIINQNDYHCFVDQKNRLRVERTIEIMVHDHNAAEKVRFTVFHNDMIKLKSLDLRVIDNDGDVINSYDEDDFQDRPVTGSALYNTNRIIPIHVSHHTFPYKVRLEYTTISVCARRAV